MIIPSYFKNQFMDTFGSVAYVLEFCGIYFSCFLFIKLIVDLIVMILRHMEINRPTGAWFGFGKTLLSAYYNLFLTSILTSVFNHQGPLLQALEPESTTTRMEDETRDPANEKKKRKSIFIQLFIAPIQLFPLFDLDNMSVILDSYFINLIISFSFIYSFLKNQTTNHFLCWKTTNSTRCSTELTGINTYPQLI